MNTYADLHRCFDFYKDLDLPQLKAIHTLLFRTEVDTNSYHWLALPLKRLGIAFFNYLDKRLIRAFISLELNDIYRMVGLYHRVDPAFGTV